MVTNRENKMVTIIDTSLEIPPGISDFFHHFERADAILIPIFVFGELHPRNTPLSLLYVQMLDNGQEYVIPFDHSEAPRCICPPEDWIFKMMGNSKRNHYVLDKKVFSHICSLARLIDINILQYVDSGSPLQLSMIDTSGHKVIKRHFHHFPNLNQIIPITNHVSACGVLSLKMREVIDYYKKNVDDPSFQFLNWDTVDILRQIEESGVHVERDRLMQHFSKDVEIHVDARDRIYTEYNVFTSTGRPSNRFGGVNFSALKKKDGTRSALTSRYAPHGCMVYIDYDAYHLILIADLLNFTFPKGNIHEYLGRQYFKTEEKLTEAQYEESKKISFQQLYGGIKPEYRDNPFFSQVQGFVDYLWEQFTVKGYIITPIGQRKLHQANLGDMYPQKLFNYFIQLKT